MTSSITRIAFFDVDETLIATKSMFDFLMFLGTYEQSVDARAIIAEMQQLNLDGVDRCQINVAFWKAFAGLSQADVQRTAQSWADVKFAASEKFFIKSALERLIAHKRDGHIVALVSGSSGDIISPIADRVAADRVLATRMCVVNGRYSGDILSPVMIGSGKREAAQQFLNEIGADPTNCSAYGDHISDLPLLELVGHPVVVGAESELAQIAKERMWLVLPGIETMQQLGTIS